MHTPPSAHYDLSAWNKFGGLFLLVCVGFTTKCDRADNRGPLVKAIHLPTPHEGPRPRAYQKAVKPD